MMKFLLHCGVQAPISNRWSYLACEACTERIVEQFVLTGPPACFSICTETSVLVHGSEGMDGTLLACSLAQVILDPDCRTVRGFEALVEREWLQAGHPFLLRCQHGAFCPPSLRTKDQSPTFLIFLDCVFQVSFSKRSPKSLSNLAWS